MTNVEQYINNDRHCFPPTNTDSLNIPKRCSRHLLVDKYLSEYKTEQEKKLVMQNILLMDSVPKENSNRLVDSGTVYKVMREGKLGRDQLTELFNYLQRTKADKSELENILDLVDLSDYALKSELFSGSYNDLTNKPNLATQEYVQGQINNLIDGAPEALNTLKEITDKLSADGDIVDQILNQINEKANKSDVYTKVQLDNLLEIEQENISGKAENSDLQQTNELVQQLQNKIQQLESKQENIKHEILTQEMYDNLQQYDPYTVYFIVEQLPPTPIDKNYWAFGDGFPIIFSEEWTFGDGFPIIFSPGQESQEEEPQIDNNGYEYVDLGLPSGTLWAKYNVGAQTETEYGNYYQYGKGAAQYTDTNGGNSYSGDEDPLTLSADTAAQVWGGSWHMPTETQMQELISNTTFEFTTINGINGGKFTAQNGNYIFIPAAGDYSYPNGLSDIGTYCYMWSSTPDIAGGACILSFSDSDKEIYYNDREFGFSIRGVLDNNNQ